MRRQRIRLSCDDAVVEPRYQLAFLEFVTRKAPKNVKEYGRHLEEWPAKYVLIVGAIQNFYRLRRSATSAVNELRLGLLFCAFRCPWHADATVNAMLGPDPLGTPVVANIRANLEATIRNEIPKFSGNRIVERDAEPLPDSMVVEVVGLSAQHRSPGLRRLATTRASWANAKCVSVEI